MTVDCIQPCQYQVSNSYVVHFKNTKIYVWENDDSTGSYYRFAIRFGTKNAGSFFILNLDLDNKHNIVDDYGEPISSAMLNEEHCMCLDLFNTYLGKTK